MLCICATEVVVEDGKERGRVDRQRCRAGSFGGMSATLKTVTATTYGLTSASVCAAFWMKIADEDGPSGIVASRYQKTILESGVANRLLFFFYTAVLYFMPSEETKVRSLFVLTPSALTRIPQERILKAVELGRVRSNLHRITT